MNADGTLDAVDVPGGFYRFRYLTPNGAEYWGPKLYHSAAAAKRAGRKWLEEQTGE